MIEIVGTIGSFFLIISGFPQLMKCYKDGHANGIAGGMLALWGTGTFLMLIYVAVAQNDDVILILNYLLNLIVATMIVYYKVCPRKTVER